MPTPKKTESTMPSAESYFTRVVRTIPITSSVAEAAGDRRADDEDERCLAAGEQEREGDPRQRGVRDRVAEEALPPQHGEAAERPARRCPSAAEPSATVRRV